ncbi:ATP-dependent RNA helicase Ddx1-like [Uranotaenia lowii]|uniref:ATP-dependent RNA helicase Ddx1-like n=1 Tax=Uranotaenia lowii TaxID=190385 RepID=UPI00247933FB|nr:ATP-dependent RNA helicase Ddx1-like [Uranotaenia lowii]
MTAFEEFGVMPELGKAIEEQEWVLPTDVQAEAIPLILGGGDVLMAAETGSGKTGAFCLPILQIVWETLRDIKDGRLKVEEIKEEVVKVPWTMCLVDRDEALAVTPDGLRCQSRDLNRWQGCRATTGVKGQGKFYYEATVTDEGLCRIGWSMGKAKLNLGTDKCGFGYGGTGKKSHGNTFSDYGESFGQNDVIGCLLDLENGEISFTKNGNALGTAFKFDVNNLQGDFYPAVVLKNAEIAFNFGSTEFKYLIPEGFSAINAAQPDDVAINLNINRAAAPKTLEAKPNAPQAIIIEPSRELAEQTVQQIRLFKKHLNEPEIRELLLVGGGHTKDQIETLKRGVDIIVSTPGRLESFLDNQSILLTSCRFLVLDEADELVNPHKQNCTAMIEKLHKQIPKTTADGQRLQMVVCSATLHSPGVAKLAETLMNHPTWVDLKGEDSVPDTVHHVACIIDPRDDISWQSLTNKIKTDGVHPESEITLQTSESFSPEILSQAVKLLKAEYTVRAINEHRMPRAIIFCRTKLDCDNMERFLNGFDENRYSCACLHADRTPEERKLNLERFRKQEIKFLICTDVAARGIDVSGLPFIINVTMPDDKSNYVHRIGRVGRSERMGLAISLVSSVPEKVWYHKCPSRGKNCSNTDSLETGGCCIWYNEMACLGEVEEHLVITVQQIGRDLKVPMNEFDGKVTYGERRRKVGSGYQDHVLELEPVVKQLAALEKEAQLVYLRRFMNDTQPLEQRLKDVQCV